MQIYHSHEGYNFFFFFSNHHVSVFLNFPLYGTTMAWMDWQVVTYHDLFLKLRCYILSCNQVVLCHSKLLPRSKNPMDNKSLLSKSKREECSPPLLPLPCLLPKSKGRGGGGEIICFVVSHCVFLSFSPLSR